MEGVGKRHAIISCQFIITHLFLSGNIMLDAVGGAVILVEGGRSDSSGQFFDDSVGLDAGTSVQFTLAFTRPVHGGVDPVRRAGVPYACTLAVGFRAPFMHTAVVAVKASISLLRAELHPSRFLGSSASSTGDKSGAVFTPRAFFSNRWPRGVRRALSSKQHSRRAS